MRFFFYGTLLDGSDNPVAQAIHALLEPVGPATVRGALYAIPDALGWFPALVAGEGIAHGKVYAARPGFSAADLAGMDGYEDFDPASPATSLYVRQDLELTGGGTAQVYVWNRPLPGGAEPIVSGSFWEWLDSRGMPQFRGRHGG